MKVYFGLLLGLLLFTSCDDGDVIVTNFDFEEETISRCGDSTSTVLLYKVNNSDIFESISFQFNTSGINDENTFTGTVAGTINIPLNDTNQLVYRTYNGMITGADYFCQQTPPSSPRVNQEFTSTTGGSAQLVTRLIPDPLDEDGDGISNNDEGMAANQDTDGDGIPDFQDIDDDGDNVPTSSELGNLFPESFLDTDEDSTPDYLDPDDDGDNVPTRNEDEDMDGNPINDLGPNGPLYLDLTSATSFEVPEDVDIANMFMVSYRTSVTFSNLTFDGEGIQAIEGSYDLGDLSITEVDFIPEGN